MFGFGDGQEARDQVYNGEPHEGHLSHELVGGAAAFEGMRLWEQHQRNEGEPVNHAFAKEALAGFVGAEVDKLAETKGEDWYSNRENRERAKESAQQQASQLYDQHYGGQDNYDPNNSQQPSHFDNY